MKAELYYSEHGWEISVEPESEIEKCAFEYLAYRPTDQLVIRITRLGVFSRKEEGGKK